VPRPSRRLRRAGVGEGCIESLRISCWQHRHPPLQKAQGRGTHGCGGVGSNQVLLFRTVQLLTSLSPATQWVPRPSRSLRRAGVGKACAEINRSCVGSISTRPCKKRKDGAPTVLVAQAVELSSLISDCPTLDFAAPSNTMGAPSFAQFAKGGSRECLRREPIDLVLAASPPALAKSARTGHPRFWLCRQSKIGGATPLVVETKSLPSLRLLARVRLRPGDRNDSCSSAIPPVTGRDHASPDCDGYTSASLPACSS